MGARLSYEDAIKEVICENAAVSKETVADWYNYCWEVIVDRCIALHIDRGLISGLGKIVQIDEAKLGRRKYHRMDVV